MKKIGAHIECSFLILSINAITFFLRPFTFSVINAKILYLDIDTILETVSYLLIYFLMVASVSLIIRSSSDAPMPISSFAKAFFTKLLPYSIGIRIISDVMLMVVSGIGYWLSFVIEFLCLFFVFYISCKFQNVKRPSLDYKRAILLSVFAVLSIVTIFWYSITLSNALAETAYLESKYTDTSFLYEAQTVDFYLQMICMVFSIFIWALLFVYFGIFKAKSAKYQQYGHWRKLCLKYLSWVLIAYLCIGIKALVIPKGTLSTISSSYTRTESLVEKRILTQSKETEWKRKLNYTESFIVMRKSETTLTYGNDVLLRFEFELNRPKASMEKIETTQADEAYRCDFYAVAYEADGKAFAIKFDEINKYDIEDRQLISICKRLIEDGYFQAFEYSYAYLQKYDREYVNMYIEKLKNGEADTLFFADKADIKSKYIQQFIQQLS